MLAAERANPLETNRIAIEVEEAPSLGSIKEVSLALANKWPLEEHQQLLETMASFGLVTKYEAADVERLENVQRQLQAALPARELLAQYMAESAVEVEELSARETELGTILKSTWRWLFSTSATWKGYQDEKEQVQQSLAEHRARGESLGNVSTLLDTLESTPQQMPISQMRPAGDSFWALSEHGRRVLEALKQPGLDLDRPYQVAFPGAATSMDAPVLLTKALAPARPVESELPLPIFDSLAQAASTLQAVEPTPQDAAPLQLAQALLPAAPSAETAAPLSEIKIPDTVLPNVATIRSASHRQALEELVIENLSQAGKFQLNNLANLIVQHALTDGDHAAAENFFKQVETHLTVPTRVSLFSQIADAHLENDPADYLEFLKYGVAIFDQPTYTTRIVLPMLDSDETRLGGEHRHELLKLIRGKVSVGDLDKQVGALIGETLSDNEVDAAVAIFAEFSPSLSSEARSKAASTILESYEEIDEVISFLRGQRKALGLEFSAIINQVSGELRDDWDISDIIDFTEEFASEISDAERDLVLATVVENGDVEQAKEVIEKYTFSPGAVAEQIKNLLTREYEDQDMESALAVLEGLNLRKIGLGIEPSFNALIEKAANASDASGLASLLEKYGDDMTTVLRDQGLSVINQHGDFDLVEGAFDRSGLSCSSEVFSKELSKLLVDEYDDDSIERPLEYLKTWRGNCDDALLLEPAKALIDKALDQNYEDDAVQVLNEFYEAFDRQTKESLDQRVCAVMLSGELDLEYMTDYLRNSHDTRSPEHIIAIAVALCSAHVNEDCDVGVELFGTLDDEGVFGRSTSEVLAKTVRALISTHADQEGAERLFVAYKDRLTKEDRRTLAAEVFE